MFRRGKTYTLTYSDSNLPAHYGWKSEPRLDELERKYALAKSGKVEKPRAVSDKEVLRIIAVLDNQGRWVSSYAGERLVGQAKMPIGAKYLSSQQFSDHLTTLSRYLRKSSSSKNAR